MSALSKEELYRLVDEHREHPAGKRIVLFGAGKIGHAALAFCEAEKIAVACIADNNQTLWGQTIQGVRVIPPRDIPALKPTLVILAVGQSAEIAEQLDGYGIDCYLSYFLFQYRYHVEELAQPGALPTERACGWLLRNQQENGGVSVFRGSPDEYPEVTGYIIPTMLQYGFQDEALRMAGFLASKANGDGSFTAADSSRVYVFDTAQALRGLNAICKVTGRYTDLRQKTAASSRKTMRMTPSFRRRSSSLPCRPCWTTPGRPAAWNRRRRYIGPHGSISRARRRCPQRP